MNDYTQLVVWPGTMMEEKDIAADLFEMWMEREGFRAKFAEEVETLPDKDSRGYDVPETGGRHDVLFYVHSDDIMRFSLWRLKYGMRWWEDALETDSEIYPQRVLDKYQPTW